MLFSFLLYKFKKSFKVYSFEILDEDKYKLQITLNSLNIKAYYELNSYNGILFGYFYKRNYLQK